MYGIHKCKPKLPEELRTASIKSTSVYKAYYPVYPINKESSPTILDPATAALDEAIKLAREQNQLLRYIRKCVREGKLLPALGAIDLKEDRAILDIVAEAHVAGANAVLLQLANGTNRNIITSKDLQVRAREYAEKHYG